MIVVLAKTNSGLRIGEWMRTGAKLRERKVLVKKYHFTDRKGQKLDAGDMEPDILDRIDRI